MGAIVQDGRHLTRKIRLFSKEIWLSCPINEVFVIISRDLDND